MPTVQPSKNDIDVLRQQTVQLRDSFLKCIAQHRPARIIYCFICNKTGHLQSQCIVTLNKRPKAIFCNKCCGFGHLARLCERAAVPVAELVALNFNSTIKTKNEPSGLAILWAENSQLKAQIAELLPNTKQRQLCSICHNQAHCKECCSKRFGLTDFGFFFIYRRRTFKLQSITTVSKVGSKGPSESIVMSIWRMTTPSCQYYFDFWI